MLRFACCVVVATGALGLGAPAAGGDVTSSGGLQLTPLLPGGAAFTQPVYVTAPPGDARRVLVVQQTGVIRLVKDGALQSDAFVTVPDVHNAGEQGLLSMAFAPDYATTGRFYVFYSDATSCNSGGANCDNRVDEFRRGADADHGDPATRRRVLKLDHQTYQNHNGGQLHFGPDGALYVSTGDGGSGGDPLGSGQNRNSLLGKLLRIDPRGATDGAYTVPAGNPFVGVSGTRPEVWAYGLRNPWRFSFDRLTGDLAIGDVGQNEREEVDFQLRAQGAGANYGWNVCEGDLAYPTTPSQAPCPANPVPAYAPPVLVYGRGAGICGPGGSSITGGFVVRDASIPMLLGRYVYADYCRGFMRSAVLGAGGASGDGDLGISATGVSSFGEDAMCRLYVASVASGVVYRLEAQAPAAGGCQTAPGPPGGGPVFPSSPPGSTAAPPVAAVVAPVDATAPVVGDVALSRSRFVVGGASTALIATARGTAFRFSLSEPATVTVAIDARLSGRRAGGRCRAASRRLRRRPRCTRSVARGSLVRVLGAGARSIPFSGRLGRRPLTPGSYRATLTARDAAGNVSPPQRVAFSVVAA